MGKDEILEKFSKDPDKYYKVSLFEDENYMRRSCENCNRYFWTLDENRVLCPDDDQKDNYSFIGKPPTSKRLDYVKAWEEIESFFVKNGHTSIGRYPVVCRWRDDLYFTVASIVDFQRVMGSKVAFEFPANPLIVPQTCLRFKDIENVGVTGRHFSSFCMIGQHSIPEGSTGYWKDKCIELDFKLLTDALGIDKKQVTFVEDVWEGGGSFGSSLEYFVNGLELGNAVFTEFQGSLNNYTELEQKIIDMGAGLERFSWISMGTPTAYDCCFGPSVSNLCQKHGVDIDSRILEQYFKNISKNLAYDTDLYNVKKQAAKTVGLSESQLSRQILPLESIYLVSDHLRTLIFAITDGALPSNVGGGYNLRMILRRAIGTLDRMGWNYDIDEIVDQHIDYLKSTYPELDQHRNDVKQILSIETSRYGESKTRMKTIAESIKQKNKTPSVDDLITLYESHGITPDFLRHENIIQEIPSTFYSRLSDLHQGESQEQQQELGLDALDYDTELLYYKDDPQEFSAKVIKIIGNNMVVLDRTSFYPRGGGQEPDHGTIDGYKVLDVNKHGNTVVHTLSGGIPEEGKTVNCQVDTNRRNGITKHHTSTHILNSSARRILGSWVWQHSAFKEKDHARLDITHHSSLTREELSQIENLANSTIQKNLPVYINEYNRGEAEKKFGFKIYQGGVVPVKLVRIVSVDNFDIEACGGTHVQNTGELGILKITRSERIQDGVIRLEFVAGDAAIRYIQQQEKDVTEIADLVGSSKDKIVQSVEKLIQNSEHTKRIQKALTRKAAEIESQRVVSSSKDLGNVRLYCTVEEQLDEQFHITIGENAVASDPNLIYCVLVIMENSVKILVFAGKDASKIKKAGEMVREISKVLGGSGGGNNTFGQGGGRDKEKIRDALLRAELCITGK